MSTKTLSCWLLSLLFSACSTHKLDSIAVQGNELHASLVTQSLAGLANFWPPPEMTGNPFLSEDPAFVEAISKRATQGAGIGDVNLHSALYAVHSSDGKVLGIYGLHAATSADADRAERKLRDTWAYGASLDAVRVHRAGDVLVVVWTRSESVADWEAINESVVARLWNKNGTR